MVQTLLSHGVKLDAKNHKGETALHVVSRGRHDLQDGIRVTQLLLEHGVDVNAQDNGHNSPLHSASYFGNLEIARVLLNHGAQAGALNGCGETPLHRVSHGEYKSQADCVGLAQLLLAGGVDVNARDNEGLTPLHGASWCGKLELARLLLEHVDLKNERVQTLPDLGLEGNIIPENRSSVSLTLFLEHDVDSTMQHGTPLHFACFRGKPEIVRLLLDHGARVNVKGYNGEIPLHLVSQGDHESLVDDVRIAELLLERGTDVNAPDKSGWTPLHYASNNGKHEIAQVLLSHDANVNAENYLGETPLRLAPHFSQDNVRITQLLLDGGADVNAQDKRNRTPLHAACHYGCFDIAQVLLNHGARTEAADDESKTPLHQVSQGDFESKEAGHRIVELLLQHGVDMNARDMNQETPLHVASRCGRLEIVQVLLGYATDNGAQCSTAVHLGLKGTYIYPLKNECCLSLHTFYRAWCRCECTCEEQLDSLVLCMLLGEVRDCTDAS